MKPQEEIKYKLIDVQPTKAVIVNSQRPNEQIQVGLSPINPRMTKIPMLPHLSIFVGLQTVLCFSLAAQSVERIEKREVVRRQHAMPSGEAALARGKVAMKEKNFVVAHEEFRAALTYLPDAVVSGRTHDEALEGFCDSGVKLAEQRIAEGKYGEAEGRCGKF